METNTNKTEINGVIVNFLLDNFFLKESFAEAEYPNWREIATKLIRKGTCVVAGEKPIWSGGIGNFIKTHKDDGFVGCLVYEFDLFYLMKSELFKDFYKQYMEDLYYENKKIVKKIEILSTLDIKNYIQIV